MARPFVTRGKGRGRGVWYGYFWLDLFSVYPEVVEAGAVFRLSPRCSCNTSGVCNDVLISVSDSVLRTFSFMSLIFKFLS